MTRCPAATRVGKAARVSDLKLLPNSAPAAHGSTAPTDWTCNYVPADQYQRWLHGSHNALSVEIYLFPKKIVNKQLLGTVDGHAALRAAQPRSPATSCWPARGASHLLQDRIRSLDRATPSGRKLLGAGDLSFVSPAAAYRRRISDRVAGDGAGQRSGMTGMCEQIKHDLSDRRAARVSGASERRGRVLGVQQWAGPALAAAKAVRVVAENALGSHRRWPRSRGASRCGSKGARSGQRVACLALATQPQAGGSP